MPRYKAVVTFVKIKDVPDPEWMRLNVEHNFGKVKIVLELSADDQRDAAVKAMMHFAKTKLVTSLD